MKKVKKERGITLVALIITVVVLLILAGVSISAVQNAGILTQAQEAANKFNTMKDKEQSWLDELLGYLNGDRIAPESVFIWKSEDPNDEGYGTVVGYTANTDNYSSLRFPERCTKIEISPMYNVEEDEAREVRRYTGNIREVELPDTIVEIGESAFSDYEFDSLQKINIPRSVKIIGDYAFEGCHNLTSIIYEGTIEEWKKISKGYNWNYGVPAIYLQCSDGQVFLTSGEGYYPSENYEITDLFIWASNDPTHPGYGVLVGYTSNVENYTTLTIPERCTQIQIDRRLLANDINWVMRAYTQNIKEIELPNTITEIGSGAFSEYIFNSVEKINIPKSITTIGDYAFTSCEKLSKIVYNGTKKQWSNIQCGTDVAIALLEIVCSDGNTTIGKDGKVINCEVTDLFIWKSANPNDEGYGTIVGYTSNVQNYTTLIIPDRCTKIEYDYNVMGDPTRGNGPRTYTGNIKEVELPETVTVIGDNAFFGHTFAFLEKINIPSRVITIGSGAFSGCENLISINIPNNVTSIGESAFYECSALTTMNIPSSVNSIGYGAFSGCSALTTINIPSSVNSIGYGAFSRCSALTTINLPSNIIDIGDWLFNGCSSLVTISIPSKVTSIGELAFDSCTALTTVNIPNSVNAIGDDAFWGCTSLSSIIYEGTMAQWEEIDKGDNWKYEVPATYVQCSDGTVSLSSN